MYIMFILQLSLTFVTSFVFSVNFFEYIDFQRKTYFVVIVSVDMIAVFQNFKIRADIVVCEFVQC